MTFGVGTLNPFASSDIQSSHLLFQTKFCQGSFRVKNNRRRVLLSWRTHMLPLRTQQYYTRMDIHHRNRETHLSRRMSAYYFGPGVCRRCPAVLSAGPPMLLSPRSATKVFQN